MLFDAPLDSVFGGDYDPDDVVAHIIRLLRNAAADEWNAAQTPSIREYWADAQAERGPGADQPAICYVWSPTTTTLERFSRDETEFDQSDTVEVQVWSLYPNEAKQLQSSVAFILSKYLDDNRVNTPYSDVAPTGKNDFREQKPARSTDHYVMSVEIETRGLSPTREINGTAFESGFDSPFA